MKLAITLSHNMVPEGIPPPNMNDDRLYLNPLRPNAYFIRRGGFVLEFSPLATGVTFHSISDLAGWQMLPAPVGTKVVIEQRA